MVAMETYVQNCCWLIYKQKFEKLLINDSFCMLVSIFLCPCVSFLFLNSAFFHFTSEDLRRDSAGKFSCVIFENWVMLYNYILLSYMYKNIHIFMAYLDSYWTFFLVNFYCFYIMFVYCTYIHAFFLCVHCS